MNNKENVSSDWEWEINSTRSWFKLGLKDLYFYRGLILRFVRRDLLASYQQTIIGPLWLFLQPLLTTIIYMVVFGNIVKISTDGIPKILFYLSGSIIWNFFFDSLSGTMYTFITNSHIFSKAYFPRLVMPASIIITQMVKLLIQSLLFVVIYFFYHISYGMFNLSVSLLLVPYLIILTAAFAMGAGLLISVFTAKYRDVDTFIQYILRLFMFATPVVFPSSIVPAKYEFLLWLNPLTPVIETFRSIFFNSSDIRFDYLLLATVEVAILLLLGLVLFKKREIEVMDII
ncbi:lipopolysaccharide transport system permease protein [Pedobacter sp. AK017]|uniref:ABC transporter permease n=1 Tax=Pedobacter sp. AK017 TaxID=2723073 RepID=UPI0016158BCA|nr:ABC transporter permease [Pedobacter sp. AK017]MBB5440365.1 lipopolysaccharide transport system permease protein [Pedobacter sp. AK017]